MEAVELSACSYSTTYKHLGGYLVSHVIRVSLFLQLKTNSLVPLFEEHFFTALELYGRSDTTQPHNHTLKPYFMHEYQRRFLYNKRTPSVFALPFIHDNTATKLSWVMKTRETALLDASKRSRYDAASAADEIGSFIQSVSRGFYSLLPWVRRRKKWYNIRASGKLQPCVQPS